MTTRLDSLYAHRFPCEHVDLTLANRVLGELAKQDGDLGADYWGAVLGLLNQAGRMHDELLRRGKKHELG